jgi:hypothetical protein
MAPGALTRSVHLSYGDDSAVSYAWQLTSDLAMPSWDWTPAAVGTDPAIDTSSPPPTIYGPSRWSTRWRDFGIFAPPVPVPHGARRPTGSWHGSASALIRSSRAAANPCHFSPEASEIDTFSGVAGYGDCSTPTTGSNEVCRVPGSHRARLRGHTGHPGGGPDSRDSLAHPTLRPGVARVVRRA